MTEHSVVIAGGGPTGMMLAGELALAGVDVAIVERRTDQTVAGSRAGGLHARSIELLDQRGIADRFLREGKTFQIGSFAWVPFDIGDLPTRHPYSLALWQAHVERILAGWVAELPVTAYRGRSVAGFTADEHGVDVRLDDGAVLRAAYLVGCDGGRSLVRKAAGIGFPGSEPTVSNILAEAEITEEPPKGLRHDALGVHGMGRLENGHTVRIVVSERTIVRAGEPTLGDLSAALVAVYGTDFGVHSPTWITRFTDATRQADAYRKGRVLLAGDAAHVHYPVGGQGLNMGLQDAVNLGWKLAQVVKGVSPECLLDSYHAERHPAAARLLRATLAQLALLRRPDERPKALAETLGEILRMDEPRRHFGALLSGLDVRYDLGDGHPLLGRRMPDLDLPTAEGPIRTFSLLHAARPVLLDFGTPGGLGAAPWADRVRLVAAAPIAPWKLPVLGDVPPPAAVLIRPDGHVAWVGTGTAAGLADALGRWFGKPSASLRDIKPDG